MADFESVACNGELKRQLMRAIADGTLAHAYLIEGSGGADKRALADAIAKSVLCRSQRDGNACGSCGSCVRFEAGSHPDITVVGRDGRATIGVDTIREVRADTHIIPSESDRKVYIVEDADTMTPAAQNALLLSLEEPPPYVLYLLLCTDSKSLLETIRSRAACLRLRPCSADEIEEYALRVGGARAQKLRRCGEMWAEMLVSSGGSAERAISLLDERTLSSLIEKKREAESTIESMMSRDDGIMAAITVSAKKMKRDEASAMLEMCECAVRDMAMAKKLSSPERCFFASDEAAASAAAPFNMRTLVNTAQYIRDARDQIESNMSILTSLLSLAIRIRNI